MARTKVKQPEIIELNEEVMEKDMAKVRPAMLAEREQEKHDVFELGKFIGRIETSDFFLSIGNSILIKTFEDVKKSKAWKNLPNPKNSENQKFQSLEEFCEVKLGKSYKRLQEMSANIRTLGEEAYEQAEKLGLRQVDYNAIKALPAPDQELIRHAIEDAQTKEEVQQALEVLASKYSTQQQELEGKLKEAEEDLASKNELMDKKNKTIDKLEAKLKRIEKLPPDEVLQELQREAQSMYSDALGLIRGNLRAALEALQEHAEGHDVDTSAFMAGLVAQLKHEAIALQLRFGLPDIEYTGDMGWLTMSPEALDAKIQEEYGERMAEIASWGKENKQE